MNAVELADALAQFGASTVYEAAGKIGDMNPTIRPIIPGLKVAGIAFTVRVWPRDTLGILKAIDTAPNGSVIVVDAGGSTRSTVWGGTSSRACIARGIRGCVTNGSVRDVDDLAQLSFPVFASGVSPRGTVKTHPGWLGLAISVGDCMVNPGDLVVGDSDGVVVVSAGNAARVLENAKRQDEQQRRRDARASSGESLCSILGLEAKT